MGEIFSENELDNDICQSEHINLKNVKEPELMVFLLAQNQKLAEEY